MSKEKFDVALAALTDVVHLRDRRVQLVMRVMVLLLLCLMGAACGPGWTPDVTPPDLSTNSFGEDSHSAGPKTMNIAIEGASLSAQNRGYLAWSNNMAYLPDHVTGTNIATIGERIDQMLARAATFDSAFDDRLPTGHNVAWFWCEGNDIHPDGSGDLGYIEKSTALWVTGRHERGWLVVAKTIIPCGLDPGYEAARQKINTWLRSGASGADYIDDVASDWPGTAADYPDMFAPDTLHTSAKGAKWIAQNHSEPLYLEISASAP